MKAKLLNILNDYKLKQMNEKQAETKIKRIIRKRSLDISWTNKTKNKNNRRQKGENEKSLETTKMERRRIKVS